MTLDLIFLLVALMLIGLSALALIATGIGRLDSSVGILRDGLPSGDVAPSWRLPDLDGHLQGTPSGARYQLLLFADHSLKEFETVPPTIVRILAMNPDAEAIMLARGDAMLSRSVIEHFGLDISIVPVGEDFYHRYRVRVMPFMFVVDPDGLVRSVGLANREDTVLKIWRKARLGAARDIELQLAR